MRRKSQHDTIHISDAEWRIMRVLWENNGYPKTLGDIIHALSETTEWSGTTIRTLLIRLAEKNIVNVDRTTGIYKYTPAYPKEECVNVEVDSFVSRVFDNSSYAAVASLVKKGNLSKSERREIIGILNNIDD